MHSPPDRLRLALAVLASLILHAALLFPPPAGYPARDARTSPAGSEQEVILSANLSPAAALPSAIAPSPFPPNAAARTAPPTETRGFQPAERLSRPPRPLEEVNLELPEARLLIQPGQLLLTLWIDAEGRVVSFRVDAPDLPEEYTTAVAEAFSATRFAPGEMLGRRVGSILKILIQNGADIDTGR